MRILQKHRADTVQECDNRQQALYLKLWPFYVRLRASGRGEETEISLSP